MNILEFHDVHRAFKRGIKVLDGVDFVVEEGEVVGLLGRNGAGKTTLLHIAMGMLHPQSGWARVFGLDPLTDPVEVKRQVGFVSEEQILPPFLKVREVLELHRGLFTGWDDGLADDLVERFEIDRGARIRSLSKGQARQVALLCAIAHRPRLLLLDEPAGGLDPVARREFLETAIQQLNESGTTILFSSHYMSDVERLAERVVMLHAGTALIDSGLDQLRESFSLALVPRAAAVSEEALLALEGCVGVRRRLDAVHAVFELEPADAEALVEHELGVSGARCRTVALEEMFIEVMGGQG